MKVLFTVALMAFSLTSIAAWNEVECTGKFEGKTLRLEIEESFPRDSYFKRAELTVTDEGAEQTHHYTVTRRTFGFNKVQYSSAGLRLEVDHWPDQIPRWGRSYRAELLTSALGNQYIRGLECRFPNMH